ncbi:MAG: biotin attachment protein, partial [Nitrosopumilus sp.]|nr:biotin attachment protein [Nitrosopumilus sp.]
MEIKVDGIENIFHGEIVKFDKNDLILKIDDVEYKLKFINFQSNLIEFIFDNSFYEIRVLESTSTDLKILINGDPLVLKKHSKLAEIIEKSSSRGGDGGQSSQNYISSQIPGRIISVSINKGDSVKKGDSVVVLESMKMQVAIKSH